MTARLKAWTLAVDTATGELGYVMDTIGPAVQLRPVAGGREWDADPACVRPATDKERLAAARARTLAMNPLSERGESR